MQPLSPNLPVAGFLGDTMISGSLWTGVFVAYLFDDAGVLDGPLNLGPDTTLGNFGNNTIWETTFGDLNLSAATSTSTFAATEGESTPVPEPATLLLFAAGAAALGLRRRARRSD